MESECFLLGPIKQIFPKRKREKRGGGKKELRLDWWKCPCALCTWVSSTPNAVFCFFFILCSFYFFDHLQKHNFFLKNICYFYVFFILFNKNIIINLYYFYFSSSHFSQTIPTKVLLLALPYSHYNLTNRLKVRVSFFHLMIDLPGKCGRGVA